MMERLTVRINGFAHPVVEGDYTPLTYHRPVYVKIIDRLAYYEDMEEQGRLVVLPCSAGAELVRAGRTFKADHWNHTLTAFRENPATRSGRQVALFSIKNAEQALKEGADQ